MTGLGGGVGWSALGGWCLVRGSAPGGVPGLGGCLVRGGLLPGGAWSGGVCSGGLVSQHALMQNPPCEQNDKQV